MYEVSKKLSKHISITSAVLLVLMMIARAHVRNKGDGNWKGGDNMSGPNTPQ